MKNRTVSVALLSGKGGVGKSNLALNLGYCVHSSEHSVLLVDCDIGLANIDILLGISPDKHLQNIIFDNLPVNECLISINNGNSPAFDLIPANTGITGLTELDKETINLLCQQINPVAENYDLLFMDIGAGISPTALNMSARTDIRLLVITPEPTSLTDGYAVIKVMASEYGIKDFLIMVNMAESKAEAVETFNRLKSVCEKFLDFSPEYIGSVLLDPSVPISVARQKPFMVENPKSHVANDCILLSKALLDYTSQINKEESDGALKTNLKESSAKTSFF